MKRLAPMLIILALALLVVPMATAQSAGEYKFTATGGFRIANYNAVGPAFVIVRSNGDATIKIVDTLTYAPSAITLRQTWPEGTFGLTAFLLRDSAAREFAAQGADSVYVDIGTATEVIVSWRSE